MNSWQEHYQIVEKREDHLSDITLMIRGSLVGQSHRRRRWLLQCQAEKQRSNWGEKAASTGRAISEQNRSGTDAHGKSVSTGLYGVCKGYYLNPFIFVFDFLSRYRSFVRFITMGHLFNGASSGEKVGMIIISDSWYLVIACRPTVQYHKTRRRYEIHLFITSNFHQQSLIQHYAEIVTKHDNRHLTLV